LVESRVDVQPRGCVVLGIEVVFVLENSLVVCPTVSAKGVAVEALSSVLLVLTVEGFGVVRNDEDPAPALEVAAVGRLKTTG
jgi:hypothetical protein